MMTGKEFQAFRIETGLTQRALCTELGYTYSTLSKWEGAEVVPVYAARSIEIYIALFRIRNQAAGLVSAPVPTAV